MNDVFDVFTDVTRLGERGRVRNGERDVEHSGQRLGQQRLATAGGSDEENIAFRELDIVLGAFVQAIIEALVVIVDSDREDFLRALLANHVLIKYPLDVHGLGQLVLACVARIFEFLTNNVVA